METGGVKSLVAKKYPWTNWTARKNSFHCTGERLIFCKLTIQETIRHVLAIVQKDVYLFLPPRGQELKGFVLLTVYS